MPMRKRVLLAVMALLCLSPELALSSQEKQVSTQASIAPYQLNRNVVAPPAQQNQPSLPAASQATAAAAPGTPIALPQSPAAPAVSSPVTPAASDLMRPWGTGTCSLAVGNASRLEQRFNTKKMLPGDRISATLEQQPLSQFGYNFFATAACLPASTGTGSVSGSYPLAPGDHVQVSLWGAGAGIDGSFDLKVSGAGEIILPRAGALKISGVPFEKVGALVQQHLLRAFRDIHSTVDVGQLHAIRVALVGELERPGSYDLSAFASAVDALVAAGGPTRNGSLRQIALTRHGERVATIDLYQYLLEGGAAGQVRLQDGDVLQVPVIGPVAAVAGEVKRPAIYELTGSTTLTELFRLAGGPTAQAYRGKEYALTRSLPGGDGRITVAANGNTLINDMDSVTVMAQNPVARGTVRLEGHVARPGDYPFRSGMTLTDLLGGAGNLLAGYYPDAADVTRVLAPDSRLVRETVNLADLLSGKSGYLLQDQDVVRIYPREAREEQPFVRVYGEVQQPGEYRLYEGMTLREALLAAGNLKRTAFLELVEIARTTIDARGAQQKSLMVNLGPIMKGEPGPKLHPFDEIIVRKIPNWVDDQERYMEVRGQVRFPGIYPVARNERVADIIARAGGLTDKAYLRGARYTRRAIQAEQQARMDDVLVRAQDRLTQKQAEVMASGTSKEEVEANKSALETMQSNIARLKALKSEGRMIVNLDKALAKSDCFDNFEVVGGDVLEVPAMPGSVNIMGQVYTPISMVFVAGLNVSDYIKTAGGYSPEADRDGTYLIRADGSVVGNSGSWFGNRVESVEVLPGDTLVVPQRLDNTAILRTVKDVAGILGQVALTAGVVLAAGL